MSAPHGIAIDDRDPACIVVRWPARRVGLEELERFAEDVTARSSAVREPVAVLVDVRTAAPLEPAAMSRLPAIDRRVCASGRIAARAIVVPSRVAARVVSMAITALRPRVPTRAFDDPEQARLWARDRSRGA